MGAHQKRFFWLSLAVLGVFVLGLVISVVAKWPAQFGGAGDPDAVATEFLSRGTALAPPLVPFILLGLAAVLATRADPWGTLGIALGTLLAIAFTIGSFGEALAAPSKHVPTAALVAVGVIGTGLGVLLFLVGVHALLERRKSNRTRDR